MPWFDDIKVLDRWSHRHILSISPCSHSPNYPIDPMAYDECARMKANPNNQCLLISVPALNPLNGEHLLRFRPLHTT